MYARSRGFTLVEIVVLIAVVAAALVGVLLVFQNTVRGSVDPQVRKQVLAVAEALLDEILLASYDNPPGGATRADFNGVDDYAGYSTSGGMKDIEGNAIAGLESYNVTSVTVTTVTLNDTGGTLTPVTEAKRITVTVSGPEAFSLSLDGYRVRYAGP